MSILRTRAPQDITRDSGTTNGTTFRMNLHRRSPWGRPATVSKAKTGCGRTHRRGVTRTTARRSSYGCRRDHCTSCTSRRRTYTQMIEWLGILLSAGSVVTRFRLIKPGRTTDNGHVTPSVTLKHSGNHLGTDKSSQTVQTVKASVRRLKSTAGKVTPGAGRWLSVPVSGRSASISSYHTTGRFTRRRFPGQAPRSLRARGRSTIVRA